MYVYTEKAQRTAEERGLDPRWAGTVSRYSNWNNSYSSICEAWKKKGYVYEVKVQEENDVL